jgi:predicted secreted hydrolase
MKRNEGDFFSFQNMRKKQFLIGVVIFCFLFSAVSVNAALSDNGHLVDYYFWKTYPYEPPESDIVFPDDEASHEQAYEIEWWYANFLLTGQDTGNQYGAFVAFYLLQNEYLDNIEIRMFSIADIATSETYTNMKAGWLSACTDHFDLCFTSFADYQDFDEYMNQHGHHLDEAKNRLQHDIVTMGKESLNMQVISDDTLYHEPIPVFTYDYWGTKLDENDELLPFQYELDVAGKADQGDELMELVVDMDCTKHPLLVSGDGYVELGDDGWSYYYTLSELVVTGSLTVDGDTEDVEGIGWIDHQWGDFYNSDPQHQGLCVSYEWFAIRLDNGQEILAGDTWYHETGEKVEDSWCDGLNLLTNGGALELLEDFEIIQLEYWTDPDLEKTYASQWHITETSKPLDLIITPVYPDQMMRLADGWPIVQQILEKYLTAGFWEGICTVTGDMNGQPISGSAYVELTHAYEDEGILE